MKKMLTIALLAAALPAAAQTLPNTGFESWTFTPDTMPSGWTGDVYGSGQSTDSHSGTYAAEIWNWYYYAKGYLVNGSSANYTPAPMWFDKFGTPCTAKPARLEGWYKYDANMSTDSLVVMVMLKRWNTGTMSVDTVAFTEKHLPEAITYTPFTVDLSDRMPSVAPDSIVVVFASSINAFCDANGNGRCCYAQIDDLSLSGTLFVNEPGKEARLDVYPNPFGSQLIVDSELQEGALQLYSFDGRLLEEIQLSGARQTALSTEKLAPGVYFLQVKSGKGSSVKKKVVKI